MPPPSPANNYQVDNTTRLDAETMNLILGSVGTRLTAREALEADFEDLIEAGTAQAIAAVQTAIAPYAEEAQTKAAQIAAYLAQYQADANPIRDAVLLALLGGVDPRGDTLAKLLALIDGFSIANIGGLEAALDSKAPLASPALTGVPTAPTAAPGTNTGQLATTGFVAQAIAALLNSSPSALDTLNELANALGNDPNFATTVLAALGLRVRVDAAQAFTGPQQAQGRANLGLGLMSTRASVQAADLPAGSAVTLEVIDASDAASIERASAFTASGYDDFALILDNLLSSQNNDTAVIELHDGSTWVTSGYAFTNTTINPAGGGGNSSNSASAMQLCRAGLISNVASSGLSSLHGLRVSRPGAGSYRPFQGQLTYWSPGPHWESTQFSGHWQSNTPITGFRFRYLGGTTTGRLKIVGFKS